MIGSISNPDDKTATDLCCKTTIKYDYGIGH